MKRLRFAVSEHLSGPPPYCYYYYYYYYRYYYSFPFRVFSLPPPPLLRPGRSTPVTVFTAARADILTPRPPPSHQRRSAHPRRDRHTHSIGPKTDFIPHRARPDRPTHHARVPIYHRANTAPPSSSSSTTLVCRRH